MGQFFVPIFKYTPAAVQQLADQVGYRGVKVLDQTDVLDAGHYFEGLVFGAVELEAPKKSTIGKNLKIPNAIVEISESKNIVTTSLITKPANGADQTRGTVKEYISMGDANITIAGVLVSAKGSLDRPKAAIELLREFKKQEVRLKISHDLLNRLEIYDVVIKDIIWMPHQYINTQPFRLICLSDDERLYDLINEIPADA